jgi:hypothetical protein
MRELLYWAGEFYEMHYYWLAEIRQLLLRVPGTGFQVSGIAGRLTPKSNTFLGF